MVIHILESNWWTMTVFGNMQSIHTFMLNLAALNIDCMLMYILEMQVYTITHAHTLSFSVFLSPFSLFLSPSVCLSIFLSLDFKKLKIMQAKQYKVYIKYLYISKSINCYMYALWWLIIHWRMKTLNL